MQDTSAVYFFHIACLCISLLYNAWVLKPPHFVTVLPAVHQKNISPFLFPSFFSTILRRLIARHKRDTYLVIYNFSFSSFLLNSWQFFRVAVGGLVCRCRIIPGIKSAGRPNPLSRRRSINTGMLWGIVRTIPHTASVPLTTAASQLLPPSSPPSFLRSFSPDTFLRHLFIIRRPK